MADCAACGSFRSSGNRLGTVVIGISNDSLKPNRSACSRSTSAPSSIPTLPNATLHENFSASVRVARPVSVQVSPS